MLPNVDYIKTVVNGLKQWMENRIKSISGALEALDKSLDDKIENLPQADWNQNDETADDYVKNRLAYLKDRPTLGTLMFTASTATKLTRSVISDDMGVLRNIYALVGDDNALEVDVLSDDGSKHIFVGRVNFDRGNIYIHGAGFQDSNDEFSGKCYYDTGQDFDLVFDNYTFDIGSKYWVEFLDFRSSIVKISDRFIPDSFFRQGNAPCNFGNGIGSVMHYGAREASGIGSHAAGLLTTASGSYSHAEGHFSKATADYAHAEGEETTCNGYASHTEGYRTIASVSTQHVSGCYNVPDEIVEDRRGTHAIIVGNGSSSERSNAYTLDWDGNAWYSGDVYVGSASRTNRDEGSKKLATEDYVNAAVAEAGETWELIGEATCAENAMSFIMDKDADGNPFALKEIAIITYSPAFTGDTTSYGRGLCLYPGMSWGYGQVPMTNAPMAKNNETARYELHYFKMYGGGMRLVRRWQSQNTTNSRYVLMPMNNAGDAPIGFVSGAEDPFTLSGTGFSGPATCVKISGYTQQAVSAGTKVKVWGVRA